jgi:hypothetical protein
VLGAAITKHKVNRAFSRQILFTFAGKEGGAQFGVSQAQQQKQQKPSEKELIKMVCLVPALIG